MTIPNPPQSVAESMNLDPTVPAPMTDVAEYGFEGRFEEWADDARLFEYSKAANPIGSGHAPQVPITRFGPEIYLDRADRCGAVGSVQGAGYHGGCGDQPGAVGQLPAHPRR